MKAAAILTIAVILLGAGSGAAFAATPTPSSTPTRTPTLRSIAPSPTSPYLYLRPTPSPFPMNGPPLQLTLNVDGGQLGDTVINVYRAANKDHIVDMVMFIMVAAVGVVYLVRFVQKSTKDQ
jgi:hypothetical protein